MNYQVEYKNQNWAPSDIEAASPLEAARLFLQHDSEKKWQDYDEIIAFWGSSRKEQQSFIVQDLVSLPPIAPTVSTAQIGEQFTENTQRKAKEFQNRANEPLSFWETVFTALYGAGLGLLGLLFVWPQASRFKSNGYILKSKKTWRLYWNAFGVRMAVVLLSFIIAVVASRF